MTKFCTTLPPKLSKLPFKTTNTERTYLRSLRKAIRGKFNENSLPKLRGYSLKLENKGSTRYIIVFKSNVYFATVEFYNPSVCEDIRNFPLN